jgi:hypothetical protein
VLVTRRKQRPHHDIAKSDNSLSVSEAEPLS